MAGGVVAMNVSRRSILAGSASAIAVAALLPTPALAGTVTKTIGSGARDFATLALWEASLPANLVTDGNSYVGQCFNDSEFTGSTTLCTLSGHTTDASHTITLTTGAGQSFRDNASVRSNALRYNATNGVGITSTIAGTVIVVSDQNVVISNLQIKNTGGYGPALKTIGTNTVVDFCILASARESVAADGSQKYRNTLMYTTTGAIGALCNSNSFSGIGGPAFYFCNFLVPSDLTAASEAFNGAYSTGTMENCAVFNCTAANAGSTTWTFTTCMTDIASPPTGFSGGKTYGNQFVTTTAAAFDAREKTGADLQGAGTSDATNGATDISGTARPQGGKWDIGAWELTSAAPASGGYVGVGSFPS